MLVGAWIISLDSTRTLRDLLRRIPSIKVKEFLLTSHLVKSLSGLKSEQNLKFETKLKLKI